MNVLEVLENAGIKAIHRLRIETLDSGHPFMINVSELPAHQCYLEFPDHSIKLVVFSKDKGDFIPIKKLSSNEILRLKRHIGLL